MMKVLSMNRSKGCNTTRETTSGLYCLPDMALDSLAIRTAPPLLLCLVSLVYSLRDHTAKQFLGIVMPIQQAPYLMRRPHILVRCWLCPLQPLNSVDSQLHHPVLPDSLSSLPSPATFHETSSASHLPGKITQP